MSGATRAAERAEPVFDRLAVVGLGLLGGSVALAARARRLAREIRVVDPAAGDAVPFPVTSLEEAASWATEIVLAVPVDQIETVVEGMAPHVGPDTLVTDTASVKVPMAEAAHRFLPVPENCVGAHPMAGGDVSGFAHASADLFEGAACILALAGREPPAVVDRVEQFWQGLGTFTDRRTPAEHDAITAQLSHAPHLIAYAFAMGLAESDALGLAGPGLRDFVRIARANPALWCEILLRNRERVAEEGARFRAHLEQLLAALERGDGAALEEALRSGQRAIEKLDR